jgi:hypothetical protein
MLIDPSGRTEFWNDIFLIANLCIGLNRNFYKIKTLIALFIIPY